VLFDGFDSAHLTYPMKTANINASELFQKLKNIQGLGAVINIPISPETHIVSRDMLEQIYHERPILGGRAYKPKSFIHDDPFLAKIVSITDKSGQILRTYEMNSKNIKNIEEINTLQLQEAGFRFFVVHWDWLNDDESQQIKSLLEKHCDLIEESREEQLSVYEIHK
jgi:hypothetical protein